MSDLPNIPALSCPHCGGIVDPTGWVAERGFPYDPNEQIKGPECTECGSTAPDMLTWNRRSAIVGGWFPVAAAAERATLACQIADQLMDFPLLPQPGDTPDHHASCLKIVYINEITRALNEAADSDA